MKVMHFVDPIWSSHGNLIFAEGWRIPMLHDSSSLRFQVLDTSLMVMWMWHYNAQVNTLSRASLGYRLISPMLRVNQRLGIDDLFDWHFFFLFNPGTITPTSVLVELVAGHFAMHCWAQVLSLDVYAMSFKGDWKYLRQLFNLQKHASCEKAWRVQNVYINNPMFKKEFVYIWVLAACMVLQNTPGRYAGVAVPQKELKIHIGRIQMLKLHGWLMITQLCLGVKHLCMQWCLDSTWKWWRLTFSMRGI